jgi:FkbM family methyltransferase
MRNFVAHWNDDADGGPGHSFNRNGKPAQLGCGTGVMLNRYWHAALRRLDRPGWRHLLPAPASVWVSFRYRRPCLVYWRDGAWIHHYRGAKIPHAELGRAAPPHVFTARAHEMFIDGYKAREGEVVFDIGAGIGTETLVFSRLVGVSGRVVSIEAHPRTFRRLVDLCRVNRLSNVTTLQVAVADREGAAVISDLDNHLRNTLLQEGDQGIEVRVRRIETIAAELGITSIDLLKMNIEGAEKNAIRGVGALLAKTRNVCISCHDFLADEGGGDELRTKTLVREFLTANGFAVTSREDAVAPWVRDCLYGRNTRI